MVTFSLKLTKMENNDSSSSNGQTSVTINSPSKVIYCSDGVIEDIQEDNVEEVRCGPQNEASEVDPVSERVKNSTSKQLNIYIYLYAHYT